MTVRAYYNEFDPFAAEWIRQMIGLGVLPPGEVDDRSIRDVQPSDLKGFTQCHFFAGIGGWAFAARLAGWPDDRELWTGSCPCQPFSTAGKGRGYDDPRDLWPDFLRLIRARRPAVVVGEQVAGKAGVRWLDRVGADLARQDYAGRGVDIPACAVDAPNIRQRLWWAAVPVAYADRCRPLAGRRDDAEMPRLPIGERRADVGPALLGRSHGPALGHLADAGRGGPRGRSGQPGRDLAHGQAAGWREGAGRASDDHARSLVDPSRERWGEGRPERGLLGRGYAAANSDAPRDVADAGRERGRPGPGYAGDGPLGADLHGAGAVGHALGEGWQGQRGDGAGAAGRQGAPRSASPADGRLVADADVPVVLGIAPARQLAVHEPDARTGVWAGAGDGSFWRGAEWIVCHDGKARRAQPGVPLLAHGVSARIPKWRGFGNAINPQLAKEVLAALLDVLPGDRASGMRAAG